MDTDMLNLPPTIKRVLLGLQIVPLIALVSIALALLIDNPQRSTLVWLRDSFGVAKHVYPAFMLVCAAFYTASVYRLYSKHDFGLLNAATYGLVSAPILIYALLVWYVQAYVYVGGPIVTPLIWALLAWALLTIHAFNISFSLWLREIQQRERLKP